MAKVLAIYSSDALYATRFMAFLKKKKELDFDILVFTRKEYIEAFSIEHSIEILILEEALAINDISKNSIKYTYYLLEDTTTESNTDIPGVFKYQSAQNVIEEIILDYSSKENIDKEHIKRNRMDIISIVPIIKDSNKLSFAWALSLLLSERKKVLLILLDLYPISMFSNFEGENYSLSDFIYYLKENRTDITMKMHTLTGNLGRLTYLSGLSSGMDLLSLSKEDIGQWLNQLNSHADYNTVLFYLDYYADSMLEIVNQSTTVMTMIIDEPYEQAVVLEWERQLKYMGISMEQEKFHKISIPKEGWTDCMNITEKELKNSAVWDSAMQYARNL